MIPYPRVATIVRGQPQGKPRQNPVKTEESVVTHMRKDVRPVSTISRSDFVTSKQAKARTYEMFRPKIEFTYLSPEEHARRVAEITKRSK